MTDMVPVISLRNASIYNADYSRGGNSAKNAIKNGELVLSGIDLDIHAGEFVYLIGRVGSGKSSFLKTLYGELPLVVGEGSVAGYRLNGLKQREIPYLRRKMGIVFQEYNLLDDRNVHMNLHFVMKATGWRDENQIRNRIDQVLGLVDLQVKGYKMPHELSGGERQRLAIARALLNAPDLLLADEPTGNLDPVTAEGIMEIFAKVVENGCAVVMSTHNTNLLDSHPARSLLFAKGRIHEIELEKLMQEQRPDTL